ncbi:MAG TPA: energy transducer TonB [Candidatus Angelobacter sp.]
MNNAFIYEQLDEAIEAMMANAGASGAAQEASIAELMMVASDLRQLPRPDFKARLKTELKWVAAARPLTPARKAQPANGADVLPSLFGNVYGSYPMRHSNFAASLLLHAAAMVIVLGSTFWWARQQPAQKRAIVDVMPITISESEIVGAIRPHGGGGGGDRDRLNAPNGDLPLPAARQITPPVVVVANDHPHLPVEPTIVAPNLHVPQPEHMGDPLSRLVTPSNGSGVSAGLGSGNGSGVGSGGGPGFGPGSGGGYGGSVFSVGNGVTAPRVIYDPDPEYSPEARAARYQGTVKLWAVIGPDGRTRELRVQQSVGMGLDEKALEAVRKWRFEPATMNGHPVAVQIEVEVGFHLY